MVFFWRIGKRIIGLALVIAIFKISASVGQGANLASGFAVGDYIQLGKYNGQPILWRYIDDTDENGILFLSDTILCTKAFDAKIDDKFTERSRGSNFWEESNLRGWLNSSAAAGDVEWPKGNVPTLQYVNYGYKDYSEEKGFLHSDNFTQKELSLMKTINQWIELPYHKLNLATNGKTEVVPQIDSGGNGRNPHESSYKLKTNLLESNLEYPYAGAMYKVTDTMFLPSLHQMTLAKVSLGTVEAEMTDKIEGEIKAYYTKAAKEYYDFQETIEMSAELTPEFTEQIKKSDELLAKKNEWNYYFPPRYWTRTPFTYYDKESVVIIGNYSLHRDYINDRAASASTGVRPAFYLNETRAVVAGGSGSEEDPYVLDSRKVGGIAVFHNGSEVLFDQEPVMEHDRVLVPVRAIFEATGAEVEWEEETQTVTARTCMGTVIMQADNPVMTVDGEAIELDVPPRVVNGRTLVPVRAAAQGSGARVEWLEGLQRVVVTTGG